MKHSLFALLGILFLSLSAPGANASVVDYFDSGGLTVAAHALGDFSLQNAPDYDWYHGCSPTSAGMLAGYYDIHGYGGLSYDNLLPGAVAESNTFASGSHAIENVIASSGHINDFYRGGTGASDDDLTSGLHEFDSLADFMGTSQDSVDNPNGSTIFTFYTDGTPLYGSIFTTDDNRDRSGMYGIWEYFNYRGYNLEGPGQNFYNQYIEGYDGALGGFSFDDYKLEINSGRPVLVHIEGHSMFGYGYEGDDILFHDTWSSGEHRMTWGGEYSGDPLMGVTVVIPAGGSPVPTPASVLLLGSGLLAVIGIRKRG
jgi:hypothetical protein